MGDPNFAKKLEVQSVLMRRFMKATALDDRAWANYGYAEAFDKAWKNGERNPETLYTICLSTKSKVNHILSTPA